MGQQELGASLSCALKIRDLLLEVANWPVAFECQATGTIFHHPTLLIWQLPQVAPRPAVEKPTDKPPKFYPADDVKTPISNRRKPKPTKLRASITPGTVFILLTGRFMGKRVMFLKQLPFGLILVIGPFKVNGVPLRRVNQSYVIGTSTKVDISGVNVDKFDNKYFTKEAKKKMKTTEGEFFDGGKEKKKTLPQEKKDDHKVVDSQLLKAIEAVLDLKSYLVAQFTLSVGSLMACSCYQL